MWNGIEFKITGKNALFTDPLTRVGGEKSSYPIPTYDALRGIVESIYWKPSIRWIIDSVRVMNKIQMESKGIRPLNYGGRNSLAYYSYLRNVEYKVRAYFVFNEHRTDLRHDFNEDKHFSIAKRALKAGGRRDIFLGRRECQGYVEPTDFEADEGAYDNVDLAFGTMVHGFSYPGDTGRDKLEVRLWNPDMKDGIITFIKPEECSIIRPITDYQAKEFKAEDIQTVDELYQEMKGGE